MRALEGVALSTNCVEHPDASLLLVRICAMRPSETGISFNISVPSFCQLVKAEIIKLFYSSQCGACLDVTTKSFTNYPFPNKYS